MKKKHPVLGNFWTRTVKKNTLFKKRAGGGSKAVLAVKKKQTFPYRIASLCCHVFFNLRSGEFNTRGSSPALDEICLLHFCGSLLSIRDVLLK